VDVILIEPGLIKTGFCSVASRELGGATTAAGPYADFNRAVGESTAGAYETGLLARLGGPPEAVAERIEQALIARRPRARYTVTASAKALLALNAVLPDAGWDAMLRSSFPTPGES
jgi:hypothetical protein